MDLPCDTALENDNFIPYVKFLQNDKTLCSVCMMKEKKKTPWERYKMKCGHVCHSRCWRRLCHVKDAPWCPFCGKIVEKDHNMYCHKCDTFGHFIEDCDRFKRGI